jgi:hypothetical protein
MGVAETWGGVARIWQAALSALQPSRCLDLRVHHTKTPTIKISRDATVEQLRSAWSRAGPAWIESPCFHVDFGESEFHQAPDLIFTIAKICERTRIGLKTSVELPTHREVLNFLRDLRFPNAIEQALGVSLEEILTDESRRRLERASGTPTRTPSWASVPTLPFNVFPIEALFVRETGHIAAADFASRWLSSDVVSALDQDLGGKGKQVVTHVVLEALMYAVERQDTKLVLTAAHYGALEPCGRPQLMIVFWDDGKSIAKDQTSDQPYDDPQSFMDSPIPRTYNVEVLTGQQPSSRSGISSRELFELQENDPRQVLQTISPVVVDSPHDRSLGGLEVLANSVLDVFSGELEVVTGNVRVTISSDSPTGGPDPATPVKAVIEVDPPGATEFCGNLLTLKIPLSR